VVYAVANSPDRACKALREALRNGYALQDAVNDPELATLQGNPEFSKLMKEFNKKS
jgi:hypothetical protein